jgi:predicted anti-sigma-YlaC factor YlaD
MRSLSSSDNADSTVDLLPDDLLPGMMATRQARRRTMQNKAILTSLVGLALVVIVAISTAFVLTDSPGEPFAVETEAEIVTMQDLASA